MAVTKLSNSGIKTGVLKYDSMLAGNAAYDPAATWLIARTSPTSGTSVTFSSIPSTYQHLQIRYQFLTSTSNDWSVFMRINGDTGSNYVRHRLRGNRFTASAAGETAQTQMWAADTTMGGSTTNPLVGIIDIHDYASSTKNKTIRVFSGTDRNTTGGGVSLFSGLWLNTNAVTSITLNLSGDAFKSTGCTFALYGYKGA